MDPHWAVARPHRQYSSLPNLPVIDNHPAMKLLFDIALCWSGIVGSVLALPPRFAAVFADHMVVQRGIPVPLWDRADPHAK